MESQSQPSILVRQPAVAGHFYSSDPAELKRNIQHYMELADLKSSDRPKALIAPHAGYIYSGPVAATAYATLDPIKNDIKRVVLLGPAHRVFVRGLALSSATHFATPLGQIKIDQDAIDSIKSLPQVVLSDQAHALEHSLEVHLPFLQMVLDDFELVPLVVGEASPEQVAEVLNLLWGGDETLIVISSDLSHYHDYDTACNIDRLTTRAIEKLQLDQIDSQQACGCRPVCGLLKVAREKNLNVKTLDLRNSGDTAGPRDRVVGYGAYSFSSH